MSVSLRSVLTIAISLSIGILIPCTVFYASDGNLKLGGNNEDWSDPDTWIWFYPAAGGNNGWIKFGFGGGYPQGGVNDHGVFWDGTSCSYLPMPYSEANKELYDGPLMKKVMEECGSIAEAQSVFDQYYCTDLYNAQYLLGDSTGCSMIVEGDNLIVSEENFQVMTNFYHSHPELGGYPCWRYDTAVSMLEESQELSTYLIGAILSATHQEGPYPTRYSNIYDLGHRIIYLFFNHNYEEFMEIDIAQELESGYRYYKISTLFSRLQSLSPADSSMVVPDSLTISFQGKSTSYYELYLSTDPDFTGCEPIPINPSAPLAFTAGFLLPVLLGLSFVGKKKGPAFFMILLVTVLLTFNGSCTSPTSNSDHDPILTYQVGLNDLDPDQTYYWKINAHPEGIVEFTSTSRTFNFTTE